MVNEAKDNITHIKDFLPKDALVTSQFLRILHEKPENLTGKNPYKLTFKDNYEWFGIYRETEESNPCEIDILNQGPVATIGISNGPTREIWRVEERGNFVFYELRKIVTKGILGNYSRWVSAEEPLIKIALAFRETPTTASSIRGPRLKRTPDLIEGASAVTGIVLVSEGIDIVHRLGIMTKQAIPRTPPPVSHGLLF